MVTWSAAVDASRSRIDITRNRITLVKIGGDMAETAETSVVTQRYPSEEIGGGRFNENASVIYDSVILNGSGTNYKSSDR